MTRDEKRIERERESVGDRSEEDRGRKEMRCDATGIRWDATGCNDMR